MKILKCDLCEKTAQGETFEAWMEALKPHYDAGSRGCYEESLESNR